MKLGTPCRANGLDLVFMDLDVFLLLPFPIETMFLEGVLDRVSLMISLTIQILEWVRARFSFLCFKLRRVWFFIRLTTPSKFTLVLPFMGAITLNTFWSLYFAREGWMLPSPAVFALRDTRISVSAPDCSDEAPDIEAPIDETLGFCTALSIPDINPYDGHVQFGWNFNNSWLRCKGDIVEDVVLLDDCFDIRGVETVLEVAIWEVRNTYDLEIGFVLWQPLITKDKWSH